VNLGFFNLLAILNVPKKAKVSDKKSQLQLIKSVRT